MQPTSPTFKNGLLDGRALSSYRTQDLADDIRQFCKTHHARSPCLAVVQVGHDQASSIYVANKRKLCQKAGVNTHNMDLPHDTSETTLLSAIDDLNADPNIDGILVQLPLPQHIRAQAIIEAIAPEKDVDGFHPLTIGRLLQKCPTLSPCTPQGIMTLLKHANIQLEGKHAVIVGASSIVGKPLALTFLHHHATITVCHAYTKDLAHHVRNADILVVAIGKRDIIQSDWLQPGVVVVDVGIHRLNNGKIVGDIDFETAKQKASWITPVPGGVGPMTVLTLVENTFAAYKMHRKKLA